ncbi:MAG: glycosyltransferase [Selenomonadaceae bacterium]|nr:glycosyltransferase [Selenomonadaceae bacterium]
MEKKKPIRILHVLNSLNRGGAETMLMNYYRKIDRSRFQFDFVVHDTNPGAYADEVRRLGGHIYYVPKLKGYNLFSCIFSWQKIFREAKDDRIVQGHMPSTAGLYLLLARFNGRFAIVHAHSDDRANEDSIGRRIARKILYQLTRQVAQRFYGCSKQAGMARYGKAIVESEAFSLWHNAIDYGRFAFRPEARDSMRHRLDLSAATFVMGHVGRFTWAKNHEFLIQLFAEFHRQHSKSCLLLVGDGELRSKVEQQIRKLGISKSVIMTGAVDNVEDYMAAMDVFIFPSQYEGLSTVNIEAQINGLKCLVSTGVPEEVCIAAGQVKFMTLTDKREWLSELEKCMIMGRTYSTVALQNRDYDITSSVKWAEAEYQQLYRNYSLEE